MKFLLVALFLFSKVSIMSFHKDDVSQDELVKQATAELNQVLKTQTEFVKAHAAEYLIWLGRNKEAKAAFIMENELHGELPKYRVVIWRVLVQAETDPVQKKRWTDLIFKAFADETGPDRLHAAETLGKLKLSPLQSFQKETYRILRSEKANLYVYTLWATSHETASAYEKNKSVFFDLLFNSDKDDLRKISAFILRREGKLNLSEWKILAAKALNESSHSPFKNTLLNTAFATVPNGLADREILSKIKAEMLSNAALLPAGGRIELALVLADHGDQSDLQILKSMMDNENCKGFYEPNTALGADVRATAAYAILKIKKRT